MKETGGGSSDATPSLKPPKHGETLPPTPDKDISTHNTQQPINKKSYTTAAAGSQEKLLEYEGIDFQKTQVVHAAAPTAVKGDSSVMFQGSMDLHIVGGDYCYTGNAVLLALVWSLLQGLWTLCYLY